MDQKTNKLYTHNYTVSAKKRIYFGIGFGGAKLIVGNRFAIHIHLICIAQIFNDYANNS